MPSTDSPGTRRPGRRPDAATVREALLEHAGDLFVEAFGPPASPHGHEWRPRGDGAVSMWMSGDRRGLWNDFSSGDGGDLLDLVAVTRCGLASARDDFPRVLEAAARLCGLTDGSGAWRGVPGTAPRKGPDGTGGDGKDPRAERAAVRIAAVIERLRPAAGTPAAAYLAGRGVTDLPPTGLGWLPPSPGLPLMSPRTGALLVWAIGAGGWPTGGQRVLVTPKGRPSQARTRKPAFGMIKGFPARFPARDAGSAGGPLVVAEGPESALSVRQATGLECWAVFGVSGFAAAPLPEGREVILAPDRDAPDSPAGHAFRAAVSLHLEAGARLAVAEAPEPAGSRRDLNDTLRRRGVDAVRAAVDAARPAGGAGTGERSA